MESIRALAAVFDEERPKGLKGVNLALLTDQEIYATFKPIPGIGEWTVSKFLINHLHRPDVADLEDLDVKKVHDLIPFPSQHRRMLYLLSTHLLTMLFKSTTNYPRYKGFEFWLGEASGYFSKNGSSLSKAKMAMMRERSDRWSPYRSLASTLLLAVGQGVEGRGPLPDFRLARSHI